VKYLYTNKGIYVTMGEIHTFIHIKALHYRDWTFI